jgi:hypothetical protein
MPLRASFLLSGLEKPGDSIRMSLTVGFMRIKRGRTPKEKSKEKDKVIPVGWSALQPN